MAKQVKQVKQAKLKQTDHGLVRQDDGWFTVNLARTQWKHHDAFGCYALLEGQVRFPHTGIHVHVLEPGQPSCHYHREDQQEDFLVLSGRCKLIVDGEERELESWDFFHCPPGVNHVFVGAGDGPCAILMIGRRDANSGIVYPVEPAAARHGASVEKETTSPAESYAAYAAPRPGPAPDLF